MPDQLKMQIAREIYIAPENLDADEHLLSIIGSWGDTLNEEEILALLKHYNATDKEFEDPASPADLADGREALWKGRFG